MTLQALLKDVPILQLQADLQMNIRDVCYDSRKVTAGAMFVAITGYAVDGHRFIGKAAASGAAVIVCEKKPEQDVPYVLVESTRQALALIGANRFGHPADHMCMIGVTGTNGKTTTTYLLKHILESTGKAKVGLIGTNQNMVGQEILPTERTTPESYELQELFALMYEKGCTHVIMEVSSHALFLHRVDGFRFRVGIFTNLTEDHLDFHKTMEEYGRCKSLLFSQTEYGVVNLDDDYASVMLKRAKCPVMTYSAQNPTADLMAAGITLKSDCVEFDAVTDEDESHIKLPIPGRFSVYNALGVISAAMCLGISLSGCAEALKTAEGVKGRCEVVPTPGKPYTVIIDYSHTPDSLENILKTVRGFCKGSVIAVFGCGGDRDPFKRPVMGKIAARLADVCVVTSDNPRTEDPFAILRQITAGMEGSTTPTQVIENRVEAIGWAMDHAQTNDCIVLCGKGHETYQEINHVKHHLDEREVVSAYLEREV